MFSLLILTLNEERNLPDCLASVNWCDDVVVLDSGSTDRTREIAAAHGAKVAERPFTDFAGQRNWAHDQRLFRNDWVFHLDADERFTAELRAECTVVAAHPPPNLDGFFVAPRMIFQGRWIRHCTDYPAWQARFVRAQGFRFVQVGHGQRESPAMRLGRLQASYDHLLPFGTPEEWLTKHERYAREEAAEVRAHRLHFGAACRAILGGPPLERRRALKRLWFRLPARPELRFAYQYLWRRGFLDGAPGFCYCRWLSRYERLITAELRRPARTP
jgi:glycosyltransferase involved in cell wall biosynthesis